MQLIEQGKLDLHSPASRWLPQLGNVQVLDGFDDNGEPELRAPKRAVTLLDLLTHTSGFGYEFLSADLGRYQAKTGAPNSLSGASGMLEAPLLFDPGERWFYGTGIDVAGAIVEKASGQKLGAYFAEHVFAPLGMKSTAFQISSDMRARLAKIHHRLDDGSLIAGDVEIPQDADFEMGGAGLYGTAGDYLKFVRMLLNEGRGEQGVVLKPETVKQMFSNQLGTLTVPSLSTVDRTLSNDLPLPPDNPHLWGLSFMINSKTFPTGRSPGSVMWAGIANSYYWIDLVKGIGGVYLSQILPFADVKSMPLFFGFEATVYANL
jgi:methyl acetate hydrolase